MYINEEMNLLCLSILDVNNKINLQRLEKAESIYHRHSKEEIMSRLTVLKAQLDNSLKNVINDIDFYEKIKLFDNIQLYIVALFEDKLPINLLEKIYNHFENDDSYKCNANNFPYDYRYYILSRLETTEEIQGKILSSYDQISLDVLIQKNWSFRTIQISKQKEKEMKNMSELELYPELAREHRYYLLLKEYIQKRGNFQKVV